jgi:hypothetical protein
MIVRARLYCLCVLPGKLVDPPTKPAIDFTTATVALLVDSQARLADHRHRRLTAKLFLVLHDAALTIDHFVVVVVQPIDAATTYLGILCIFQTFACPWNRRCSKCIIFCFVSIDIYNVYIIFISLVIIVVVVIVVAI